MTNRKYIYIIISIILASQLVSCIHIRGGKQNIEDLLTKAKKNIFIAESLEDQKRKKELLKEAQSQIKKADSISKDKKIMHNEIAAGYAIYYYVSGDYAQVRKYSTIAGKYNNDPMLIVLNNRILLQEKGKSFAGEAITNLENVKTRSSDIISMAEFTKGDSYLLLGNSREARKSYESVMIIGGIYQVQAAGRLEILNGIEAIGVKPQAIKQIIFSKSVRRGELADILNRIFYIKRYLKFGKPIKGNFNDISKSVYADSIRALRRKGFFSYIKGRQFEPLKIVTRREMARISENYIVLATGQTGGRSRYKNDKKSPIKDVKTDNPYYGAIRIAVKYEIMNLALNGYMNPSVPMDGFDTLVTIGRMVRKFARTKKKK